MDFKNLANRLQSIPETVPPPADYPGSSVRPKSIWGTLRRTEYFPQEVQERIDEHRRQDEERLRLLIKDQQDELDRIRSGRVLEAHARTAEPEEGDVAPFGDELADECL